MHRAALVEVLAPRIRDHVHRLVGVAAAAHEPLPLHQFVAELAGKRPGEEVGGRAATLAETRGKIPELLHRGISVAGRNRRQGFPIDLHITTESVGRWRARY